MPAPYFCLVADSTSRGSIFAYEVAGGTIRYDEAIGLIPVGGNPALSQTPATVGGAVVTNNGRRETRVVDAREDGFVVGTRVVLDLAAIKAANIADGIPSGTMMDALKKRAAGKTEGKAPIGWLGSVAQQEAAGINTSARPESGVMEIHGVSLNGVTDAIVEDVLVADCDSRGSVYAIEVAGQSSSVEIEKVRSENLKAGSGSQLAQPFGDQKAVGVRVVGGVSEVKVSKTKSDKLTASRPDLEKEVEIESTDVSLS